MTPAAESDPGSGAPSWQLLQADLTAFAEGGEVILYSESSGRTVYLDPAATIIFEALGAGPRALPALVSALAARWQLPEAEIDPEAVATALRALEEAGIVERQTA